MTSAPAVDGCLSEDVLLGLASGALADDAEAERHLAGCATCAALAAAAVRAAPLRAWDALVGTTLGPYRLDAQIGAGGMGAVYRAWDPRLGRALAVKVLHDPRGPRDDRLVTEARAAAVIEHRAVVGIYDVGESDGLAYVAMELVEGESLRSALAGGALGGARARALITTLVDGVAAAHARGVVHRDLKPENLVLTKDGLRILDFGLARVSDELALDATAPTAAGTAGYMAPEQVRGGAVDARADLFAIGAIAYELATGRRAFPGAAVADRLTATLRDAPSMDGLGELAPIVLRCLAKEPDERFQTASDLAWALRTTVAAPRAAPPRASRRGILVGGVAAVAAGALGVIVGRHRRAAAPSALPEMRPLTHRSGRVYAARFTHDGSRAVVCAAWDAEPLELAVIELGTGEHTSLDLPGAHLAAVSARSELALTLDHRFIDHQSARGALVVRSLSGGVPRPLADDVQDAEFMPEPLVPGAPPPTGAEAPRIRGGALAVVRPTAEGFRIELPLDTPLVEERAWLTHLRASPDGARLAYLRHPNTDDDGGALVVIELATREPRVLTDGWASIAGLAWDPDGDSLWFTASRDDLRSTLHRVTLDGRVIALPSPTASRLRLHDVARDRRALVNSDVWRLRAIVGEADRSGSEVSYVADLSSDGAMVAIGDLDHLDNGAGTYLVPYDGGRRLRLGPGYPVAISPSGRQVAANFDRAERMIVYATGSGDAPRLTAPGLVLHGRWLDERSMLGLYDGKLWRLAFDRAPEALTSTGGPMALDPARRRCAYVDGDGRLHVLDVAAGVERVVLDGLARTEVCGWLAATDAIVIRSTTTPLVLERVDPTTGARTPHRTVQPPRLGLKAVDTFVLHADGERYAYSYGQELSQLFLMTPRG